MTQAHEHDRFRIVGGACLKGEVTVTGDKFQIALLDKDMKPVALTFLAAIVLNCLSLRADVVNLSPAQDTGWSSRLPGDGLVPVDSALGRHADPGHHRP